MAEAEETGAAAITDWRSLISSSPTGFFSECLGSPSRSFSQFLNGSDSNSPSPPLAAAEKESDGGDTSVSAGFDAPMEVFGDWKPQGARNVGGSIAERRAARCGFTAPRINTARFRSTSPLESPGQHSPYLTIPPGISPTTLLDSPIMLPNSQALPSPTTGTFPLPSFSNESPIPMCVASDTDKDKSEDVDSAFTFKPPGNPVSFPVHPSGENQVSSTSCQAQQFGMGDVNCQPMAPMQLQMDFECETGTTNSYSSNSFSDVAGSNTLIANAKYTTAHPCLLGITDEAPQEHEDLAPPKEEAGSQLPLEEDQKGGCPSIGTGKPSEDGYNWRKYGQKQVKGSEYPRSYYKCTHPNCQVKKKVERSLDGQITEIIYKGAHNHSKPQTNRRSAVGSAFPQGEISESIDGPGQYVRTEGGSIWRGFQQGSKDKCGSDWRVDGSERTASTSVVTEVSEPFSAAQGKEMNIIESADTPERSSTLASHNDDEDGATQGSMSLGDDGEDDESESKRRKKESCMIESNLASRSVREPRVVVQTDSEVDILDDGYRWRKYGQKVVKGNPNPRSYYKCTNAGCTVRKHVERASHNLKSVITTYEGKHNHEVPAARNSNHLNLGSGNTHPSSNTQTAQTLSAPANIPKPEPQGLDLSPHFDRKPELSAEYLKLGYLGRITADRTLGASSSYNLKLPPALQRPISLASFGHCDLQAAPAFQAVPDFPLSFPSMGLPSSTSLPVSGFDFNHGKLIRASHPFIGQQSKENSLRFLRPKQEEKNDGIYEVQLPLGGPLENASYHHIMGGFPM